MASISIQNPRTSTLPKFQPHPPTATKLPAAQLAHQKAAAVAGPVIQRSMPRKGVLRPDATKHLLPSMWRKIQGSDDWKELIEPLDSLLQAEVVRYGELVEACYKAFDLDPSSERYLNCKYGKARMMAEVGMDGCGYEVTKYIYATPGVAIPGQVAADCCSRWIGYVAVASDEEVARIGRRDVVVSFRGTVTAGEWAANLMSSLTPANLEPHNPRPDLKVESGFLSLYTSDDRRNSKFSEGCLREQLLREVSRLISKYKDEELSITLAGHSMGSALALLLGYDLAELGLTTFGLRREIPITVYSFGGPRVGNARFKQRYEEHGVKVLRVANVKDPVTKLPGVFLNESFGALAERYRLPWSCSCYSHVGVELAMDFFSMENLASVHDLSTYINLLKRSKLAQTQNGLLSGAWKLFSKQKHEAWLWQDAAKQMGDLMQSLGLI